MIMNNRFLFYKKDMLKVMEALDSLEALGIKKNLYKISMGNCGWAKAPDCWFIFCRRLKEKEVRNTLIKYGVELLSDETGR